MGRFHQVWRIGAIVALVTAIGVVSVVSFVQQSAPSGETATAVVDPRPIFGNSAAPANPVAPAAQGQSAKTAATEVNAAGSSAIAKPENPVASTTAGPDASEVPPARPTAPAARPASGNSAPQPPVRREPVKITLLPTGPLPPVQPLVFDDGNTVGSPPSAVLTPRRMGVSDTAVAVASVTAATAVTTATPADAKRTTRRPSAHKPRRRNAMFLPYPLRRLFSSLRF
jgi:hypothetical protein